MDIKEITLQDLQDAFNTRFNGRCVVVGYNNSNVKNFIVYDSIEMVTYADGKIQFQEVENPDTPYSFIFNSSEVKKIRFSDYSNMPDHTGGQVFIYFGNNDYLDIAADF